MQKFKVRTEANRRVFESILDFYGKRLREDLNHESLGPEWGKSLSQKIQHLRDVLNRALVQASETATFVDILDESSKNIEKLVRTSTPSPLPFYSSILYSVIATLHTRISPFLILYDVRLLTLPRKVQKLLQRLQTKKIEEMTDATKRDSSAMRQFAVITLILLPVTVVSVRN